jgi:hypothetical protein
VQAARRSKPPFRRRNRREPHTVTPFPGWEPLDNQQPSFVLGYDRVLLEEALRSARDAEEAFARGEEDVEAGRTAGTVLCAAGACEYKLSEYLAYAEFGREPIPGFTRVRALRGVTRRWRLLLSFFDNPRVSFEETPQIHALDCLFKLRNHMAHRNTEPLRPSSYPDRLAKCVGDGIIPARKAESADWTSVLFVHEVARWAAATARNWMAFVAFLPDMRFWDFPHPSNSRAWD